MSAASGWRATLEKNALWFSLGALLVAAGLVAVGTQVAPARFYDHFVWEDLWGPLTVDAHQCKSNLDAPCQNLGPPGVLAKDGYTITSELTYGVVLALLLYGIYQGLFRRYDISADGWFVAALLPWILLGPTGRVLEDANVFLRAGSAHDPGPFAFIFISPVIYVFIALLVIGAMLLGVVAERGSLGGAGEPSGSTSARDRAARAAALVGGALALGFAVFAWLDLAHGPTSDAAWFTALPPLWFAALSCAAAFGVFWLVARRWKPSLNLVVFSLGLPLALGCLFLIGRWLAGDVWAPAVWNQQFYPAAAAFVLLGAFIAALLVTLVAKRLAGSAVERRWIDATARISALAQKRVGYAALVALAIAALKAGILPNLASFFDFVPDAAVPFLALVGAVLLVVFVFVHFGHESARRARLHALLPSEDQPKTPAHAALILAQGITFALIVGHLIDGLATWVALDDPLGFGIPPYSEKHPFSEFLLRYWGGAMYPLAKLAMVLVVAWLLHREDLRPAAVSVTKTRPGARTDATVEPVPDETYTEIEERASLASFDERNLVGLVSMAIFVLGFAPGLRDLLRLAMGV